MSSEIVFFSSSSRSMRSTKARKCSFAIRAGAAARVSAAGAASVIDVPFPSSERGLLAAPQRFGRNRPRAKPGEKPPTGARLWATRLECAALLRARLALVFRLPFLVGHAVDEFAA